MLTDTQVQVLAAVNDHCESIGTLFLDQNKPLPDLLQDLKLAGTEVYTAMGDLQELGLIRGTEVAELNYPVRVDGLTARGRQELP